MTAEPVRRFASKRLDKLFRRIRHDGRKLDKLDDSHRHDVRKDAKRLRYAAEFFVGLYPGRKARRRLDKFLCRLENLQDELGKLNDMAAEPVLLAQLGLEASAPLSEPRARKGAIREAANCFDALVDVKRFWRA